METDTTELKRAYDELQQATSEFMAIQQEVASQASQGNIDGFDARIKTAQHKLAAVLDETQEILSKHREPKEAVNAIMDAFGEASIWYNSAISGLLVGRQVILGKSNTQFTRALKEAWALQEDAVKKVQAKNQG